MIHVAKWGAALALGAGLLGCSAPDRDREAEKPTGSGETSVAMPEGACDGRVEFRGVEYVPMGGSRVAGIPANPTAGDRLGQAARLPCDDTPDEGSTDEDAGVDPNESPVPVYVMVGVPVELGVMAGEGPEPMVAVTDVTDPDFSSRSGRGESLILVVAGEFETRAAADDANVTFGDMQGFFPVPAANFKIIDRDAEIQWPRDGTWLLASAFRTRAGADQFVEMAAAYGTGNLVDLRVRRLRGTSDIGLGQEAAPDGSGPLESELPDQSSYQ